VPALVGMSHELTADSEQRVEQRYTIDGREGSAVLAATVGRHWTSASVAAVR